MNIHFKKIKIENFRSIRRAEVELENQGIVKVVGINKYEENAQSNGSGKSSIFEAIIYAIFETTSADEKNVKNRLVAEDEECNVTLYLNIDLDEYIIVRFSKKNKYDVALYKNGEEISARNKTDTNKLILDIFKINKDLFLDSIFLSQNASTNLATISPVERKQRLEILTNTEYMINTLKEELKKKQIEYDANCVKSKLDATKNEERINVLEQQKAEINLKIEEVNKQIERRKSLGDIDKLEEEINALKLNLNTNKDKINNNDKEILKIDEEIKNIRESETDTRNSIDSLNRELNNKRQEFIDLQNNLKICNLNINNIKKQEEKILNDIDKIRNSDRCPVCKRKYDNVNEEAINNTIVEYEKQIQDEEKKKVEEENKIEDINVKMQEKTEEGNNIKTKIADISVKLNDNLDIIKEKELKKAEYNKEKADLNYSNYKIQEKIDNKINQKEEILKIKIGNKEEFENMIVKIDEEINNVTETKKVLENEYQKNLDYENVTKHIIQLSSKEFRTYLLKNSIDYLNQKLKEYSKALFSNEKDLIYINNDDTKLNIFLGDATYESLSGGEKTRVNIALLLAQKSLAEIVGNINCNIIILDEILNYCDAYAEEKVINLVLSELDDLESIFFISHKDQIFGYDKEIIVEKNKEGFSEVK